VVDSEAKQSIGRGGAVRIMQNSEAVNKRAVDSEMKHTDVVENVAQSES
jgi:hypothetical protein